MTMKGSGVPKVRRARRSEASTVARVVRQSFGEYRRGKRGPLGASLSTAKVRRHMRNKRKRYALAFVQHKPVGAIGYRMKRGKLSFGPVGVLPQYRRQGVGAALMVWAEAKARRRKCKSMRGVVLRGLEPLQRFYQSMGFRIRSTSKGKVLACKKLRNS